MRKITILSVIGLALLGLLAVAWFLLSPGGQEQKLLVTFDEQSGFPASVVNDCLKTGNGSHILSEFKGAREPKGNSDIGMRTLIHPDGSRLLIIGVEDRTTVRLRSARSLSDEELDLLQWCVYNPQLTWIPREHR